MNASTYSTCAERGAGDYLLFAIAFVGFVIASSGVIVSSGGIATFGTGLTLFALWGFRR